MSRLQMLIDSSRCIDCKACMMACKIANHVPAGQWRNWIKNSRSGGDAALPPRPIEAHYQPGGCMHCAEAPCLLACPTGATYRHKTTGVVLVDRGLCIGCGNCIPACPYGARFRHANLNVVDKCDYCMARLEQGLLPACVDTCPTKARSFGLEETLKKNVNTRFIKEGATPIQALVVVEPPLTKTHPNLNYINETAQKDWPSEPEIPLPMRLMSGFLSTTLYLTVGAAALGAGLMGLTQLRERRAEKKERDHES